MFDIGWSELLVIGSIALLVVGPKDLPGLLRQLGKYAAQARGMARDFQRSMEEAAREADISDIKELREASNEFRNLKNMRFDSPAVSGSKAPRSTAAAKSGADAPKPAAPAPTAASGADSAEPAPAAPPPASAKAETKAGGA